MKHITITPVASSSSNEVEMPQLHDDMSFDWADFVWRGFPLFCPGNEHFLPINNDEKGGEWENALVVI